MKNDVFVCYLYVKILNIKFLVKDFHRRSLYSNLDPILRGILTKSRSLALRSRSQFVLSTLLACTASIILCVSVCTATCKLYGSLPQKKSDFTPAVEWHERILPSYSNHGSPLDPPSIPPPSKWMEALCESSSDKCFSHF